MNLKKTSQGFSLVELPVVIFALSLMSVAAIPGVERGMDSARANSLKSTGRSIWLAIQSANNEREPLGKYSLWPKDLQEKKKDKISSSSLKYWQFLFSKGDGNAQDDPEMQLVADLTCSALAAPEVPTAAKPSALKADNVAWRVAEVNAESAAALPFIVTKNYNGKTRFTSVDNDSDETLALNPAAKPLGDSYVVWVTIGGASLDASKRDFDVQTFLGDTAIKEGDKLSIWEM